MSGSSMVSTPPGLPINDFSGRRAVVSTTEGFDDAAGQHVLRVQGIGGGAFPLAAPETLGGKIDAGGTAQNIGATFDPTSRYLIIQNPPDAASQGIATAENLFVAINTSAVVNGAENYAVLAPGNCCAIGFTGLRPGAAWTVSVVGATIGHQFLATHFFVEA